MLYSDFSRSIIDSWVIVNSKFKTPQGWQLQGSVWNIVEGYKTWEQVLFGFGVSSSPITDTSSSHHYHQHTFSRSFFSPQALVTADSQQQTSPHPFGLLASVRHKHHCFESSQYMSDRLPETSSSSNFSKRTGTNATSEASLAISSSPSSSSSSHDVTETPPPTAEQPVSTPVIIVTDSRTPSPDSTPRQSRSQALSHRSRTSSSQPLRRQRSATPYERPPRSRSQPVESIRTTTTIVSSITMSSSSSSPSGTSTAGSTSGSGQTYQLPYAPFPYPMPANPRGGQQQGGQGK